MTGRDDALMAAALKYAARGWPVLWLSRDKRPLANCPQCKNPTPEHIQACDHLVCHGPYAASTDPERIAAMRAVSPRGLLALATGAASGLVVVDIDPAHGGRLIPDLMPPTAHVITGSHGLHLYYPAPRRADPLHTGPHRAGRGRARRPRLRGAATGDSPPHQEALLLGCRSPR